MNFRHFQQYHLNVKFMVFWAVLGSVVGVGSFVLHRHQLRKLGDAYLTQADGSRDRNEAAKELDYLRRYLTLQPTDNAARLRLGMLQSRLATRPRDRIAAFQVLQDALRADPSLPVAVRVQAVRLALHPTVNLYDEAKPHVEALLKADPTNADYAVLMADCYLIARDYKQAETYLANAVKNDPSKVGAFARLAAIQRFEFRRFEEADATLATLAKKNPTSVAAFVAIAEHWRRDGKRKPYGEAVQKARELGPTDPEVVLTAADYLLVEADDLRLSNKPKERAATVAEAIKLYESVIETSVPQLPPADALPEVNSPGEKLQSVTSRAYHTLVGVLLHEDRKPDAEVWARKQVATFPGSLLGQVDLADATIGLGKLDEAEAILGKLDRAGFPSPQLDFFLGRIAVLRGQWPEACRKLEAAVEGLSAAPEQARHANLLLALCYQETGELDRRYEAFRRAVPPEPFDPTWGTAVLGVAETLTELGRPNDALAEYARLAALVPAANVPHGRLLMNQVLRQPAGKQDWSPVERAVAAAPPGAETELLRAELAAARADLNASRPIIEKALAADPESIRLWVARILLEVRVNEAVRAAEIYDQAKAKLGDKLELRLVKARLLVGGPKDAAAAGLTVLAEQTAGFTPKERIALLRTLSAAAEQVGRRDLARRWLDDLAATRPDDIALQTARFDLALLDGDEATVAAILATVDRVAGGPNAVPGRVIRAFYLLWKSDKAKDPALLAEASGLLAGIERQRAGWSRLYVAQARVADLTGDLPTAAKKYRQSVELGEVSPEVIRRLLELYYLTKQFGEAEQLMQLAPNTRLSGMGAELIAELSLSAKNYGRALELARDAVKLDSTDATKLLWLARILVLSGELAEAEAPLRRATAVAPKRPEAWVALVQLLTALKRPADATAAMDQCRTQTDPKETTLALAQCAETLGQAEAAEKFYQEAIAGRPNDPAVLRAVAGHRLRRGDTPGARKLLEQLLGAQAKSKDDELFARRLLATIFSNDTDFATKQKALEVLGLATPDAAAQVTGGEAIDDLRARVYVLARMRTRKSRQAALRLLDAIEARLPLTPEDQRQYAELLEALGDWGKARLRYAAALTAAGSPAPLMGDYVARLLRHNDLGEARTVLDKLIARDATAEMAIALQVQLTAAEGKRGEAVREAGKLTRPEVAAVVLERAGLLPEAEASYRQFADRAKTPAARLTLARFLGRVEKLPAAWAELDALWATIPAEVSVPLACEMLLTNAATAPPADIATLVARLETAVAAKPALAAYLAAARSLAGDQAGAMALNRQVLAQDPKNLLALNNQAFLLAAHEKNYAVALELVRQAQAVAGPLPGLLDTEGVILMLDNKPEPAAERFAAASNEEPGAVASFHLAHAYHALNRPRDAKDALADARRLRLRPADLHPLEQPTLARVAKEIDAR